MKIHITPAQAQEITEDKFYSLFDEIVKRKDWANFHHKKITIGKCIEIINQYSFWTIKSMDHDGKFTVTLFKTKNYDPPIARFRYEGFINTLWAAVKFIAEENE